MLKNESRRIIRYEERANHCRCFGFSFWAGLVFAGSWHFARQLYDGRSAMGNQRLDSDGHRGRFVLVCAAALMAGTFEIGDRVEVYLDAKFGEKEGWYPGTIFQIDPYSEHRSFYWVRFNVETQAALGTAQISVFNTKNIRKIE